jgi:Domain of unknown function (DUF4349)
MPLLDQDPIDPEIAATLDAIDATLAGEPVDGRYADVAEIALLLASDKPQIPPAFAQSLDQKVERRFAPREGHKRRFGMPAPRQRRGWSVVWQATGALGAVAALLVAIVVVVGGEHGASSASSSSAALSAIPPATTTSAGSGAASSAPVSSPPARKAAATASTPSNSSASGSNGSLSPTYGSSTSSASSAASGAAPPLQPPTTGRKVVQGAQLNLAAAPSRIDDVAQEIYDEIGQVNGIVESSNVTQGGLAGTANFELSVPSGALGRTLTALSSLNYAQVVSRTDNTQDITDQYGAATRALGDARALRTSLLKQLADAVTTEQIDSLKAQINDAEASISSDQATLNRLNHQVNYSQLAVTINAQSPPPVAHRGGGGFTLRKAAHDAGRVVTVVAGVALIAIAALAPIALVVALAWWVGAALRRRRRDQALDSV